jgi:hypothetical protein
VLDLLEEWIRTVDTLEQQAEAYKKYTERPGGSSSEGKTAEATQTRAYDDYRAVAATRACVERATAEIRSTVTSTLMPPLSNAQQIIANAEAQPGVIVNEDLSITYTRPAGISQKTADANSKVVATAAAELKDSVEKWWSAENQVAQQICGAQSEIGNKPNFGSTSPHATRPRIQSVDRHWKQDPSPPPPPPISREQARAGLDDVIRRIWEHNHIEKPLIEALPPNDPRRADFHTDAALLNTEKQQYLDVLPQQHPPPTVIGAGGTHLPGVPPGLISETPAKTGQGWIYPIAQNQPGIDTRVTSVRVMEPTDLYPHGYLVYMNRLGQTVNPLSGQTVLDFADQYAHIPIP